MATSHSQPQVQRTTPLSQEAGTSNPKIKGQLIGEFEGIKIYAVLNRAKRNGRDRILLSIRQDQPTKYRVSESLSYMRSLDIQFESSDAD
jgi:hypothetical protein